LFAECFAPTDRFNPASHPLVESLTDWVNLKGWVSLENCSVRQWEMVVQSSIDRVRPLKSQLLVVGLVWSALLEALVG
jgi:hypothetical protein